MRDSISAAEAALAAVTNYIKAEAARSETTALGRTSEFWRGVFSERPNFPSLCEFLAFRRSNFGYGMADERQGTLAQEHDQARRSFEIFRQSADKKSMAALDESPLGAPYVFKHEGVSRSAAFWTNATTALRTKDFLESYGEVGGAVNALEIGAGWGCAAHLLHQLCEVNSYTILDLPENLALSSTYLTSTLGLGLCFLDGSGAARMAEARSLVCGLPGAAKYVTQKFDFILNSFSLQEMELDTVQAYFAFIAETLSDNGLFISFNSHGKSGVRRPSQYPFQAFRLRHLGMFRRYPSGLLNTIPYEAVLSLRRPGDEPCDQELLETLCCLMQFGLGDDLEGVCRQFVHGTLAADTEQVLRELLYYFSPSPEIRARALSPDLARIFPALHAYLNGMNAFVCHDAVSARDDFEQALDAGLRGFARLRASAHLAILKKTKSLPAWSEDFDALMAYPELSAMLKESNPSPFLGQFQRIVAVDLPSPPATLTSVGSAR